MGRARPRCGRRRRCCCRARGRARREPRGPERARRRRAGAGPPPGRPAGPRGAARRSASSSRWSSCSRPASSRPSIAGLLAAGAMVLLRVVLRRRRLPGHHVDDGRPGGRDDPAVDGHDDRRVPRTWSPTPWSGSWAAPARYALLAGLFVITATLGQLISNMATALIVDPDRGGRRGRARGSRRSRS